MTALPPIRSSHILAGRAHQRGDNLHSWPTQSLPVRLFAQEYLQDLNPLTGVGGRDWQRHALHIEESMWKRYIYLMFQKNRHGHDAYAHGVKSWVLHHRQTKYCNYIRSGCTLPLLESFDLQEQKSFFSTDPLKPWKHWTRCRMKAKPPSSRLLV